MAIRLLDERDLADIRKTSANAIKGNLIGQIVRADDVSPVEHELAVKVRAINLFDISKISTTSVKESEYNVRGYITDVTEDSITIFTESTHTSNGYTICGKKLSELCPNLMVGDKFTISADTESVNKFFYLGNPSLMTLMFGNSYTATEEMLNSSVIFYGLSASASVSQGTGFCTISNIQIELGETATEYVPYIDPSNVKVRKHGKNLAYGGTTPTSTSAGMTITREAGSSKFVFNGTAEEAISMGATHPIFLQAGTYTVSVYGLNKVTSNFDRCYVLKNSDKSVIVNEIMTDKPKTFTLTEPTEVAISFVLSESTTYSNKFIFLQMEQGDKATEYVECEEQTEYIPSSDGTVEGVVSLSQTMTLFTDTEVSVVECEYIKDSAAVIQKLVDAIVALGGTV